MFFLTDSLIAIGLSTLSLGPIQEADGLVERSFWLRNAGDQPVSIIQGYPSCECTTIEFEKEKTVIPGDSTCVTLRFNPRGKSGSFRETGTLVYGNRKTVVVAIEGTCVSSEASLARQFPVKVNDRLRLSSDRFDLGFMSVGESKERNVVVLHYVTYDKDEENHHETYQEVIPVRYTADDKDGKGLKHLEIPITTIDNGKKRTLSIKIDVFIK